MPMSAWMRASSALGNPIDPGANGTSRKCYPLEASCSACSQQVFLFERGGAHMADIQSPQRPR